MIFWFSKIKSYNVDGSEEDGEQGACAAGGEELATDLQPAIWKIKNVFL